MKLSWYFFGLLAAGLVVYAALLPRSGSLTSSPKLPADKSAPAPFATLKPTSTSALPVSPIPITVTPETDPAARHRKEREARRLRQEDQRHDIRRSIELVAARAGISTNTARELWEIARDPSAAQRQEDAYRAQQRKEDLAKGENVELWQREDALDRLSAQLRNGMSLQEVKQLLGAPTKAQAHVQSPGRLALVPVPLDQIEQFQGPLTLVYSPHPGPESCGLIDVLRSILVDFGADKTLVGVSYRAFGPF